jgi:hypothetical protein
MTEKLHVLVPSPQEKEPPSSEQKLREPRTSLDVLELQQNFLK